MRPWFCLIARCVTKGVCVCVRVSACDRMLCDQDMFDRMLWCLVACRVVFDRMLCDCAVFDRMLCDQDMFDHGVCVVDFV